MSVRALMIFVLVLGCVLGWTVRQADIQRTAVQTLQRQGALVLYDCQFKNGIPNPNAKPWAPKWIIDRLGVDYFANAVYVVAATRDMDDAIPAIPGRSVFSVFVAPFHLLFRKASWQNSYLAFPS
jgi:hypothetical protein